MFALFCVILETPPGPLHHDLRWLEATLSPPESFPDAWKFLLASLGAPFKGHASHPHAGLGARVGPGGLGRGQCTTEGGRAQPRPAGGCRPRCEEAACSPSYPQGRCPGLLGVCESPLLLTAAAVMSPSPIPSTGAVLETQDVLPDGREPVA